MNKNTVRCSYKFLLWMLFSFFLARTCFADTLLLGGYTGSTSDSQYGYIGAVVPINSSLGEEGLRMRFWGNYLAYEYDQTGTVEIDGDGFGAEAALGYLWKLDQTRITGYGGVVYHDIDLDPDDPENDAEDDDIGAKLQLEVNHDFNSTWSASIIGSYIFVFDSYWTRLRPGYQLGNGITIGPEITLMGGDVWDKQNVGAYISGIKIGSVGVGFNAGVERTASEGGTDPYAGIALSLIY